MKEKLFWVGLIIVLFSWLGNYLYFESKQLEHPLFLEHYYDVYIENQDQLTFYYLSNKKDNNEVSSLSIDGINLYRVADEEFTIWTSQLDTPQFVQESSHQYLKSVTIELPKTYIPIEEDTEDIWSFDEVNATFSNGQTYTLDIGNVNVHGKLPEDEVFRTNVESMVDQHSIETSSVAKDPITVEDITIPFSEELFKDMYVKVNPDKEKYKEEQINKDIFPFHMSSHDTIQLSMQLKPHKNSYFDFDLKISGITDEGEKFVNRIPIFNHPSLNQMDLNEIIENRQGGRANEESF